jgi:hypothetical protein
MAGALPVGKRSRASPRMGLVHAHQSIDLIDARDDE